MTTRFLYAAYGFDFDSDVELPELETLDRRRADAPLVRIERGRVSDHGDDFQFRSDRAVMRWDAVGHFEITADRVVVQPHEGVGDDLVAFPLLGPVLSIVLHMHGTFLLHASAVSTAAGGVVLMGDKGDGKSTTAASLVSMGHGLMCDDIVAIDDVAGTPTIRSGFAQMKLSEPAATLVDALGTRRSAAHAQIDKVRLLIHEEATERRARPLAALLVVSRSENAAVEPLGREDAFSALLKYSYMARFATAVLSGAVGLRHLQDCATLAGAGCVHRLRVPDGIERLEEIGPVVGALAYPERAASSDAAPRDSVIAPEDKGAVRPPR